jgi:hypothetical protein
VIYINLISNVSKKKFISHYKFIINLDKYIFITVIDFKYKYLMFSSEKFIIPIYKKYGNNILVNSYKKIKEVILKLIYNRLVIKFV